MGQRLLHAGTEVAVEEHQDGHAVQIQTTEADVYVNGKLVWSIYPSEEYRSIPRSMWAFIDRYKTILITEKKTQEVLVRMDCHGEDLIMGFPLQKPGMIRASFSLGDGFAVALRKATQLNRAPADETERRIAELRVDWEEMQTVIRSTGYQMEYKYQGLQHYFRHWELSFAAAQWDEARFLECISLINTMNAAVYAIQKEYAV